jgi:Putative transposase/Transposase zinc-binding domain
MNGTTADGGESLGVHRLLQKLAPDYRQRLDSAMPERHRQVLKKILACRTPALGGQLFQCPQCSGFHYRYHSCNDRHCPQCGQADADEWLQRQRARLLLPVPYFLVTFTVPEALRLFLRSHQQLGLDLLFACSAQALQDLAANPRHLGAQLGLLGVLHTWSRTLVYHPHIHYLVPGGGLTADGRRWVAARNHFLLPVKALGAHCRTLFQKRLQKEQPELFVQVPAQVWQRHWNVDSRPAGTGENALRYLARYVFKTATANRKVELLPAGRVRWRYRESRSGRPAAITLAALDFLSRFLQHILPRGFARVRTFGWLHPAAKVRANRVRALLRQAPVLTPAEQQTWNPGAAPGPAVSAAPTAEPTHLPVCPRCRQPMRWVGSWRLAEVLFHLKRPP